MAELSLHSLNNKVVTQNVVIYANYEPNDTKMIWADNSGQQVEWTNTDLVAELRNQISDFSETVDKLAYVVNYEADPGYFKDLLPGTNTEKLGSVKSILVKRGYKADIQTLKEGEMGFCIDTEELYIGNKSSLRLIAKVGGVGGSGSGNLTGQYLELVSTNGSKYRLTVNDEGHPILMNATVDTANSAIPTDSGRYAGLFINKTYGGGTVDSNTTPVSHSFIELYNSTENTINLKGLALQYAEYGQPWKILALRGEIKPYSSFVIRGVRHTDPYRQTTRFKIMDFDMSWPELSVSPNGYKIYLNIPADITKPTAYVNPANTDGNWTKEVGYLNLFAAGGDDPARVIDAFESKTQGSGSAYGQIVNKYRIIKRKYSVDLAAVFSNTGSSFDDLEYLDATVADPKLYSPRPQKFGQWNYFYNQMPLDKMVPMNINVCFGYDGDHARTFTWQTPPVDRGYLKYKSKSSSEWITVPSTTKMVPFLDCDVTIHSAIIRNLEFDTYVYKVGSEGRWSDEYELKVIDATPIDRTIRMLQVTDQQGWDGWEYTAWQKANDFIVEKEADYDFILNTGDISQNGNRPFEWRCYYYYAKENISSHVHMTCVGNNDLVDKKDPIAYTYYSSNENYYPLSCTTSAGTPVITAENASSIVAAGDYVSGSGIQAGSSVLSVSGNNITLTQNATKNGTAIMTFVPKTTYPSLYSFNYGYCHFICLNSNIIAGFSGTPEQIDFLRRDMANPANKKRWTIVYMHEAPYAIVSSSILRPFINIFDEIGVDLVLCGHHHCYSRSKRMGAIPTTLHFEGNLTDTALKTWTASGGAATVTTKFKFGARSLYLDGVDDYISCAKSGDFNFKDLNFTIDFWINAAAQNKTSPIILSNGTSSADTAPYIGLNPLGKIFFKYDSENALNGTTNICDSNWHHIAITRSGNTMNLFVDGMTQATADYAGTIDLSQNGTIIGKCNWDATNSFFCGNIDEFHVIKKIASWTSDFAVPSAAYTLVDTVVPDNQPGTYYIMSQATGFKNSGKQTPTPGAVWPAFIDRQGDPCYIMFEISYNQIISKPYRLTRILPMMDNINNDVIAIPFDSITITKA